MKKISISGLILIILILGFASTGQAKWWIFGKSAEGIRINYLYMNRISFDNSIDPDITLFRSGLIDGNIVIKGRASVSKGSIGAVQITTDNKETWHRAKLARNGSFEFAFMPRTDEIYKIYIKIMDTTGRTNDVDATYKKVKVVDQDISGLVRKTLQKLFESYQEQDISRFMRYVSPRFEPDETLLDTAVRKDFNAFDYIQIQYVINTIAMGGKGRAYVSINYNRSVVSARTGTALSDHGLTEFVFTMENAVPKLARVKNPLLFGLSDASNIATGSVNSGSNNPILLVDTNGNVLEKPFSDAITIIENDNTFPEESSNSSSTSSTVVSGTITVVNGINIIQGYPFHYTAFAPNELGAPAGSNVKYLGTTDIDTVTSVTVSPADADFITIYPDASGHSYAVKFTDNKYMLIQHTAGAQIGSTIKYRLQTDGTSNF
jgi:hypothetical protein